MYSMIADSLEKEKIPPYPLEDTDMGRFVNHEMVEREERRKKERESFKRDNGFDDFEQSLLASLEQENGITHMHLTMMVLLFRMRMLLMFLQLQMGFETGTL